MHQRMNQKAWHLLQHRSVQALANVQSMERVCDDGPVDPPVTNVYIRRTSTGVESARRSSTNDLSRLGRELCTHIAGAKIQAVWATSRCVGHLAHDPMEHSGSGNILI